MEESGIPSLQVCPTHPLPYFSELSLGPLCLPSAQSLRWGLAKRLVVIYRSRCRVLSRT